MPRRPKNAAPPRNKAAPPTPQPEMVRRRQLMTQLLLNCSTRDEIWNTFAAAAEQGRIGHMNDVQLRRLHAECKHALDSEAAESVIVEKQRQKRRIMGHIQGAKGAGDWSAVMAGERLYAQVSGTMAPTVLQMNDASQAFVDAISNALAGFNPEQLQRLAAGEEPMVVVSVEPAPPANEEVDDERSGVL